MTYIWEDQETGKIVEVWRPVSEYTKEPEFDECGMSPEEYVNADWVRLMKHPRDEKDKRVYIRPEGKGWTTPGNWGKP